MISVVMPVYNEARYIDACIQSLLQQDYPKEDMEWIFVDGMSSDDTVARIESFREQYPDLIRVLSNPNKIVPYAMNIGIAASKGRYIIRLDAHADYEPDYIYVDGARIYSDGTVVYDSYEPDYIIVNGARIYSDGSIVF